MPSPHRPGPRWELKAGGLAWLASRNPVFQWGRERRPNVSQIAYAIACEPSTLGKVRRGELPLSQEVMAGLVKASGARTEFERRAAFNHLFRWVDHTSCAADLVESAA